MESDPILLEDVGRFDGAGLYALCFSGAHPLYRPIAGLTTPIYVGKATSLVKRLSEHLQTLRAVKLYAADFGVRCLIVDDIWIPLAENYLIRHFRPLWNSMLDGFGNHAPGAGRYQSAKPDWHVLHPGVDWADKCLGPAHAIEELESRVLAYPAKPTTPLVAGTAIGGGDSPTKSP